MHAVISGSFQDARLIDQAQSEDAQKPCISCSILWRKGNEQENF